ncbi:hypothetical protein [Nocardioides zeae]
MPVEVGGGTICIPASDPGEVGSGGGGIGSGGGAGVATCSFRGDEIPCQRNGSYWMAAHGCYAGPVSVQPPPDSSMWDGNDPSGGSLWTCLYEPLSPLPITRVVYFFVPDGAEPLPDPAVLAQSALEAMQLPAPEIGTAPAAPDMTYVGLETWLWVPEDQWAPLRHSVTAGSTTVTVEAVPTRTRWDLTTGSIDCSSPGTPWLADMSAADTTDCAYVFDSVSSREGHRVAAVLTYEADWTCSGACLSPAGTLGEVDGPASATTIRVGERQSVVVEGP